MSSFRRQFKNLVKKYSEAEIKVREATSNDPWGPSSSLMSEIADLTYSVSGLAQITTALWERLSHGGRSWRHVFKSLLLLDYLVRAGSERVAQQAREHGACIRDLQGFHYIDPDGKDQGCPMAELTLGEICPQSKPQEEMQLQIALVESTEEQEQQTESQDSVLSPPSQMRSDPWEHTLMQADNDPWRPAVCSTPAEDFAEFDPLRAGQRKQTAETAGSITVTSLNNKEPHAVPCTPHPAPPRHSSRNWATFPDTPPPPAPRSLFPDLSMAPASCTSSVCLFPGSQSRSLAPCGSQFGCSCAQATPIESFLGTAGSGLVSLDAVATVERISKPFQTGAPALSSLSPHPACCPFCPFLHQPVPQSV